MVFYSFLEWHYIKPMGSCLSLDSSLFFNQPGLSSVIHNSQNATHVLMNIIIIKNEIKNCPESLPPPPKSELRDPTWSDTGFGELKAWVKARFAWELWGSYSTSIRWEPIWRTVGIEIWRFRMKSLEPGKDSKVTNLICEWMRESWILFILL